MSDTDFDVGGHDDDSSKNFDDFQQEVMYSSTSNAMVGADKTTMLVVTRSRWGPGK
jgi:hypothetical protein